MKLAKLLSLSAWVICSTHAFAQPADSAPSLTDIATDARGVMHMNWYEANAYCNNPKEGRLRLPTARELALMMNPQGVHTMAKVGDDVISGSDSAGKPDPFYYSSDGYKGPAEGRWYWSSSIIPDASLFAWGIVDDGNFTYATRSGGVDDVDTVVRCVRSR